MGCYGGPLAVMKAPQWLHNLGAINQVSGTPDVLSWPQYTYAINTFNSYRVYLNKATTDMHYQPLAANQVDSIPVITTTTKNYALNAGASWYRISVVRDTAGYHLGGGFSEHDTVSPVLTGAYYFCNGTSNPSDDQLRLVFNEGLDPTGVDMSNPQNYIQVSGVGDLTGSSIASVNEFIINMGAGSKMLAHNRSYIKVKAGTLKDYYGNYAKTQGDSILVVTFNVYDLDNSNYYESINKASQFATPGDFLMVFDDGYYNEQLNIGTNSITIQADSSAHPVINALGANAYCFNVTADSVSIVGFKCTGATQAGIYLANGANAVRVINDTCYGMAGGTGIQAVAGATGNEVRGDVCYGNSVGISVTGNNNRVTNNICYSNTGNGITASATGLTVRNNVGYANGSAGINGTGGTGSLINNMCVSNTGGNFTYGGFTNSNNSTTDDFVGSAAHNFQLTQAALEWGAGASGENIGRFEGQVVRSGDGYANKFHTIKAAYQAAGVNEILRVYPGNYYERFVLVDGKPVSLVNSGGDQPVVHWDEWGTFDTDNYLTAAFFLFDNHTTSALNVNGFVFDVENANTPFYRNFNYSSAALANISGTVHNCTFRNSPQYGAGVSAFIFSGNQLVRVDSCTFQNGGYLLLSGSTANSYHVSWCTFQTGADGINLSQQTTVSNCVFQPTTIFLQGYRSGGTGSRIACSMGRTLRNPMMGGTIKWRATRGSTTRCTMISTEFFYKVAGMVRTRVTRWSTT